MASPVSSSSSANSKSAAPLSISGHRWWWMLGISIALLAATYSLAVLTPLGQLLENAALRGADQVPDAESATAWNSLDEITIWSLAIATALVGLIGLLGRQVLLAVVAISVIGAGQVITQLLKRFILPRPELVEVTGDYTHNSFPSGHTTVALTVLIAVLLVVPLRYRGVSMFIVLTWASSIGAYTVTAKWHRFSDTLGADLVALIVGAIAALILWRAGLITRDDTPRRGRTVYVVLVSGIGILIFAISLMLGVAAAFQDLQQPVSEWNAYLAANGLAAALSAFTGLAYWGSWRHLEVRGKV